MRTLISLPLRLIRGIRGCCLLLALLTLILAVSGCVLLAVLTDQAFRMGAFTSFARALF